MVAVELLLRVAESSCLGLHKVGCTVGDGTPALSVVRGATKDGNYPTKGVGDGDREAESRVRKGWKGKGQRKMYTASQLMYHMPSTPVSLQISFSL
jgi:hypothetical protein